MHFEVGQKVVFVGRGEAKFPHIPRRFEVPIKNRIYTIRETYIDPINGVSAVRLKEIVNPPMPECGNHEMGWYADEFRPVVERKTDISIFTKMLKPKEVEKV